MKAKRSAPAQTIKCSQCGRRLGKSIKSRLRHQLDYHADRVQALVNRGLANPRGARQIGETFGQWVKQNPFQVGQLVRQLLEGLDG